MKKKTVKTQTAKVKTTRKGLVEKQVIKFGGDKELNALTDIANAILSLKEGLTELEFAEMLGRIFNYLKGKYIDEFSKQKQVLEYKINLVKNLEKDLEAEIAKGLSKETIEELATKSL